MKIRNSAVFAFFDVTRWSQIRNRKSLSDFWFPIRDYSTTGQGGESKGKFFMEQAKMTPRKELCESKLSVMSFLPCY